jgi:hypothetical protein
VKLGERLVSGSGDFTLILWPPLHVFEAFSVKNDRPPGTRHSDYVRLMQGGLPAALLINASNCKMVL